MPTTLVRVSCMLTFFAALTIIVLSAVPVDSAEDDGVPDFRHVQVTNPARLSTSETERIYNEIKTEQFAAFARSGVRTARLFPDWKRYNTSPYLSSTHGNRFINNYANGLAKGYDAMTAETDMPAGAAFAKDSFIVQSDGTVLPGRLFIMEKLDVGQSPETGDWRYLFIETDGTVIGDSHGRSPARAAFCHTCHKIRSNRDFLFFVPPGYRPE